MRDPNKTKLTILQEASVLFNTLGYKATSLSHITDATGLTKGAIYRHFQDKSSLEREAFVFMAQTMMIDVKSQIKGASNAPAKLNAVLDYFSNYIIKPPYVGGCPLMNAAIEADDSNAELKAVVHETMASIHAAIVHVIKSGIKYKQIRTEVNVEGLASLIISALEGAIMMVKLTGENVHLSSVIEYLKNEIDHLSMKK